MDTRLAMVRCQNYNDAYKSIKKALELIDIPEICESTKVVIKPNFVSRKKPEEAATTNPAVLRAVIRILEERGAKNITVAESPGGVYSRAVLKSLYASCGAEEAVSGTLAKLNYDTGFSEMVYHDGLVMKSFPVIEPILNADFIVSLPKLKTHAMTSYTGAVKNLFGVIPGTHKAELHFRLDDRDAFCAMLVDLYSAVARVQVLSVMDGVVGMEGDGPTAGENRYIGMIGASMNAHALDMASAAVIGYKYDEVPTLKEAVKRGLIPSDISRLDIRGGTVDEFYIADFKKPKSHFNLLKLLNLPNGLNKRLTALLSARPDIDYSMCVGCGECFRDCPPKAIDFDNNMPVINREKCIKCFCCQELCPKKAIKIKRSLANRLMLKIAK